ncbi:MAG TPA: cysteine hydrolase [Ignavibacteriaceae bacterium]
MISILTIIVLSILTIIINFILVENSSSEISKGKPIVQTDRIKEALLVIDIQEGITGKASSDDFFTSHSEMLIKTVNQIIDTSARYNIPIVYVKNEISNPLINILNNSLAKGSPGAELDSRLKILSNYVINKDKADAFSNPLLDSILITNGINKLVFTGLDLAQCVNSTILAAVNRNYKICLISDAVITKPDSLKNGILEKFRQSGLEIISSEEYIKRIN